MADVKYEKRTERLDCLGLDLNRPVDSVKDKHFPYLKNCRSFVAGRLEPRFGLTDIGEVVSGQIPVHSIRRLNDPVNSTYTRVIGAGTHLAIGQAAFTDLDSGYSGDPLALQPWSPTNSPIPYMYVADRSRMRKVTALGALDTIGYAPPTDAPTIALGNAPLYKDLDTFDYANNGAIQAAWIQGGTAAAPTVFSRTPGGAVGTTTTIDQILYDMGTTGWACVALTSMAGVGYGSRLTFTPAGTPEIATVQSVHPVSVATTISRIIYDSGTSGLASIALATPIEQVEIDALVRNTTVGENGRVVAVAIAPDGTKSIRVSTPTTWAATNAIQVLASLRIYLTGTYAATNTVKNDAGTVLVTAGLGAIARTVALDLSLFSTGNPSHPDDYMCISMAIDSPASVTEIKVQLDVDLAVNDFTHNFYTRSFRASDLTPSIKNLQSALATSKTVVQNTIVDESLSIVPSSSERLPGGLVMNVITTPSNSPNTTSQEMESGDAQWVSLLFHLNELTRVGTDDTRTLANVAKIQIVILCTATVNVAFDSWWIGGGYGPDLATPTAIPYLYRYRVRNPATNVASNFSPATRLEVSPLRQQVAVVPTQYPAPPGTNIVATNLVLDINRFGGEIADWHYVGTIANSATPGFIDEVTDDIVGGNPIQANDNYQPWPVKGVPVSGTSGNIAGTTIDDSGTSFSLSWAAGTRILIENLPYTIYRVISTSRLELIQNAGTGTGKTWRIDEPTILAQPMPCLWEWDNVFFACGDPINAGRLYYSNPDSETTQINNYIDITAPSEPLQNGLQYNVRSFVFGSESMSQILKTGNPEAPYRHEQIPNGKGLFSRWALTREPAPMICFMSKDGIYLTTGGSPESLTDAELYDLFPNEGNIGRNINGVFAPNIIAAQATNLRLTYYDEFLYFDYATINGGTATLVLAFDAGASERGQAPGSWYWDVYNPNIVMHYGEEGSGVHSLLTGASNSHLYQYAGDTDAGSSFSMEFTTPSLDQGDPRSNKLYGDIMLDSDLAGKIITATPYSNNNITAATPVAITNSIRSINTIPINAAWLTARNISLNIVVTINSSARPLFYIWEPRWTFESAPIAALSWEISPSSFGMDNFKHFGLCKIAHVSTSNLSLIFTVDGVVQPTITIPASGGIYEQTIFRVPVMKGKIYKLRLASSTDFRLDPRDSFLEVKDWGKDTAYQEMRVFADYSLIEG